MKPAGLAFLFASTWPGLLPAAGAGAAPDRPFAEVRQDLQELKGASIPPAPAPSFNLGAASGPAPGSNYGALPATPTPASRPAEGPASGAATKSSGWLLDALEENDRRAQGGGPGGGESGRGESTEEEREKGSRGDAARSGAGGQDRPGLEREGAVSPLSAYLSGWLGPDEYRRLSSLYPELAGTSDPRDALRLAPEAFAPRHELTGPTGPIGGEAGLGFRELGGASGAPLNPFVQAMTANPRPAPGPVLESSRPATAPALAIPVPPPEPVRPVSVAPERADAQDRKYFPQLKRF